VLRGIIRGGIIRGGIIRGGIIRGGITARAGVCRRYSPATHQ
jgi:hypothetical protein